jgi:two-component system cell cycle response regulator DivK
MPVSSYQKVATILIIEDNVSNFRLMARLLDHIGINCEWKTSGYEVVEYIETLPPIDLILMDIKLPYEDGYQALKKIRATARLQGIPIVAVTAYATDDQMARARKAGFEGFIGKPLDADRFPEQIIKVLEGEQVWEMG